jgi:hypothetical protein
VECERCAKELDSLVGVVVKPLHEHLEDRQRVRLDVVTW